MNNNKLIFSVEGPTAGGNTTLSHIIKEDLSTDLIAEPFDKWLNVDGFNLFEKYREDQHRWVYTFQTYAFITEMQAVIDGIKKSEHPVIITDRSPYSGLCCFTKMFSDEHIITPLEWHLYNNVTSWILTYFTYVPSGFIYLRTPPEICLERDEKRKRPTKKPYTLSYFKRESHYLDEWLIHKKNSPAILSQVPVCIIDSSADFENNLKERARIIKQIKDFINTIKANHLGSSR